MTVSANGVSGGTPVSTHWGAPIPVPTRADAGIERRVKMSPNGVSVSVMVLYRHSGETFRAGARFIHPHGWRLTYKELADAREDCTDACIQAIGIAVEAHNAATVLAPSTTPEPLT
jgi:hypothetical protein